jgi:hypothetical protein
MGLSCGLVGLPNVGKTTIFSAMTATEAERSNYMFSTTAPVLGQVEIPDERLARIAEVIPTQKIVPARMAVVDIPGLISGSSHGEGLGIGFLGAIKESDVLVHVIRCFEKAGVEHATGALDPATDAEVVDLELGQADLATIARNIERVGKRARVGDKDAKAALETFERAHAWLAGGKPLRATEWKPRERELLAPLFLMTIKPILFLANVGDDDLDGDSEHVRALRDYAQRTGCGVTHLCGDLEAELVRMAPDEREAFMHDLGIEKPGLGRVIRAAFDLLGLQTFFTAGEKEVRAWVIHKGDTAPVGAGVIHTDFRNKFIRCETYSFDDLMRQRSEAAIKAAGRMRLEGKEYVLQDGDVCHFLIGG